MPKKKTFKSNPALQFITARDDENTDLSGDEVPKAEHTDVSGHFQAENEDLTNSSKTTEPETSEPTTRRIQPPEGYKLAPQFIEKRTRRVQLVLQPSVYDKIKATAQAENKSLNDYIHLLLEEDITRKEGTHK